MNALNASDNFYNFESEENSAKWKGVLISALRRVGRRPLPQSLVSTVKSTGAGAGASIVGRQGGRFGLRRKSVPATVGDALRQAESAHGAGEWIVSGVSGCEIVARFGRPF